MKVQHSASDGFFEEAEDLDALILLVKNNDGENFHVFCGDDQELKELLIHGVLSWPMFIPYDEETKKAVGLALGKCDKNPEFENTSEALYEISVFQNAMPEDPESAHFDSGEHSFYVEGVDGGDGVLRLDGVNTYLLFAVQNGRKLLGQNGYGTQKSLLAFYAVGRYFGSEARTLVEDIILGFEKEIWYKFAKSLGPSGDGINIIEE